MKILFLLPAYPRHPNGGYRIVYRYATDLSRRGHLVSVAHTRERQRPGRSISQRTVLAAKAPFGRLKDRLWSEELSWAEVDESVEMLYVSRLRPSSLPAADVTIATAWWTAARARECAAVNGGESHYLVQNYETFDGRAGDVDASWRDAERMSVISGWLLEKARELGVPSDKVRHIPYGFEHDRFSVSRPLISRPLRVVSLYHPAPWKRSAVAVNVLKALKTRVPALEVCFFGGYRRPEFLPKWMEYRERPSRNELNMLYNDSAVYLCTSLIEGWHLPPAEAMASGCALVSTDIGGVRDYALHQQTALLADPYDDDLLLHSLDRMLSDPALRAKTVLAGQAILRRHTWSASTDQFERWLTKDLV